MGLTVMDLAAIRPVPIGVSTNFKMFVPGTTIGCDEFERENVLTVAVGTARIVTIYGIVVYTVLLAASAYVAKP